MHILSETSYLSCSDTNTYIKAEDDSQSKAPSRDIRTYLQSSQASEERQRKRSPTSLPSTQKSLLYIQHESSNSIHLRTTFSKVSLPSHPKGSGKPQGNNSRLSIEHLHITSTSTSTQP